MTTTTIPLAYNVTSIRAHGLECRWGRTSAGAPIIVGRRDGVGGGRWYVLGRNLWADAQRQGIIEAFTSHCALGEYFAI